MACFLEHVQNDQTEWWWMAFIGTNSVYNLCTLMWSIKI